MKLKLHRNFPQIPATFSLKCSKERLGEGTTVPFLAKCLLPTAYLILQTSVLIAQSAMPTTNIIYRVLMVESQYAKGTIFSIDVDGREYWITAKHILTGAKHPPYGSIRDRSVSLRLLNPVLNPGAPAEQQWVPFSFSVIDPGKDIDLVVLAPSRPIFKDHPATAVANPAGMMLGGDCAFLGFPYGQPWEATSPNAGPLWMRFVKHCTIASFFGAEQGTIFLDGINNDGFSGGPVIVGTGPQQRIIAVISGYVAEPAEVVFSDLGSPPRRRPSNPDSSLERPKATVNLNSGFIVAYNINYAMEAIRRNPIGPRRDIVH